MRLGSPLNAFLWTAISEMAYAFQENGDAPQIFKSIDMVQANVLPFFDPAATTGSNAWGVVSWSISYFQARAAGKPIRYALLVSAITMSRANKEASYSLTQTGWPSNVNIWKANNAVAVASIQSEAAYFTLLDQKCTTLKSWGVGWFSQIYTDGQLDG